MEDYKDDKMTECVCCHDHNHEHHAHHHDDCDCGCHNESHHEHEHDENNEFKVNISHHEQSVIASYKFDLNISDDVNESGCVSEFLLHIGKEVEEHDGIIGHIKAIMCKAEDGKMFSVTYDGVVNESPLDIKRIFAEGVAIVFNIEGETLKRIVKESYLEIKRKYNV